MEHIAAHLIRGKNPAFSQNFMENEEGKTDLGPTFKRKKIHHMSCASIKVKMHRGTCDYYNISQLKQIGETMGCILNFNHV